MEYPFYYPQDDCWICSNKEAFETEQEAKTREKWINKFREDCIAGRHYTYDYKPEGRLLESYIFFMESMEKQIELEATPKYWRENYECTLRDLRKERKKSDLYLKLLIASIGWIIIQSIIVFTT